MSTIVKPKNYRICVVQAPGETERQVREQIFDDLVELFQTIQRGERIEFYLQRIPDSTVDPWGDTVTFGFRLKE